MTGCNLLDFGKPARQNGKRLPCERLMDENAELREQIHWLKKGDILHVLTDQEYTDQCERERLMQVSIDALTGENAKLSELLGFVLMFTTMTDGCGDDCPYSCRNCQNECYFRKKAHELGIEVSE